MSIRSDPVRNLLYPLLNGILGAAMISAAYAIDIGSTQPIAPVDIAAVIGAAVVVGGLMYALFRLSGGDHADLGLQDGQLSVFGGTLGYFIFWEGVPITVGDFFIVLGLSIVLIAALTPIYSALHILMSSPDHTLDAELE